jgi:hypothetical protein
MWMNVDIFCFIVVFYVVSLPSPQIWKKNPEWKWGVKNEPSPLLRFSV